MGDGRLPNRHQLKEDWNDFLDNEEWIKLYNEAMNDESSDYWIISQTIFNKFIEKYNLPETIKTTGNNLNFDEAFEIIANDTFSNSFTLEKFKNLCLKELIHLNLAMELTFPNLKR